MKGLHKEETVEEGTGGPIYPKPFVKVSDLMSRIKDMKNIKKAKLVNNIGESQIDETMMGKDGCTSEDDKKKAESPKNVDYKKYDKPTFLRKGGDWRKSNPAHLPKPTKEEVESIDELSKDTLKKYDDAVEKKHTVRDGNTVTSKYDNATQARNRITGAIRSSKRQAGFKGNTDKVSRSAHFKALRKEEVELDETATLDKYIRSMGYDPKHLDKNKKVMFAKTDAYKKFQQSNEALYDGGIKGTQDVDTHISSGATARG